MKLNLIIIFIFSCKIVSAQSVYEIKLNVINTGDEVYKEVSDKLSTSKFPAAPTKDTLFLKDTLQIAGYQYFDYKYRLTYGKDARNPMNKGSFRLFIKSANDIKLVVDTDFDNRLQDEAIIDVYNSRASFAITINHNKIEYEFYIWNMNLVYSYSLGGVAIQPISYFSGTCELNGNQEKILIKDEALGVSVQMDNMLIDDDSIERVMLNEPFLYKGNYYSFTDFDVYNLTIKLESKPSDFVPEGYRKGYFVNKAILQKKLGIDLSDKPVLLYFWGIWCKPCLDKFDKTLELYQKIKRTNNDNMFFCSYNRDEKQLKQCKDFVGTKIDSADQVYIMAKDIHIEMNDFIKYDSVISLLKIDTYPTYLLINKDGKIVFRDNKIKDELLLLLDN